MDKRSFLKQQEGSGFLVPLTSLADELPEERLKESYKFHIPKGSPALPRLALEDALIGDGTPGWGGARSVSPTDLKSPLSEIL